MQTGTVVRIVSDKSFGFISSNGDKDIFFHKEDMQDQSLFRNLKPGVIVSFLSDMTPKGPRARNVEIAILDSNEEKNNE